MRSIKLMLTLFLLPASLLAQVLKENPGSSSLKDPDKFPLGVYLKMAVPGGAANYDVGYQNIHELFKTKDINLPNLFPTIAFGAGLRYKRLRFEAMINTQLGSNNLESFEGNRYLITGNQFLGSMNLGVVLFQNRNREVLLKLGIGEATNSFLISPQTAVSEVDWTKLEDEGVTGAFPIIFHKSVFWDIALEYVLGRPKNRASISQTISLGYRRGFAEQAWQVAGASSLNAPVDRLGQIYFQISFNLGTNFQSEK